MFPQDHPAMSHQFTGAHAQARFSNSAASIHREQKFGDARMAFDSQKLIGSRLGSSYSNPDLATTRRLNAMGKGCSQYNDQIADDNSHSGHCKPFQKYGSCHRLDSCPYFHNTDFIHAQFSNHQANNAVLARNHMQAAMLSNASVGNLGHPSNVAFNTSHYQQLATIGNLTETKQLAALNGNPQNITTFDMDTAILNVALNQYMHNKSASVKQNSNPHISKRVNNNDQDGNSFIGVSFEDVREDIYPLCKDQHGCRFFQRKLEEQIPPYRDAIFHAVYDHFVELMTGKLSNVMVTMMIPLLIAWRGLWQILLETTCAKS